MSVAELASQEGVSLGKVNYCVCTLVNKGWVKMNNFRKNDNKSAYIYQLTPQGIAEKAALALRFLRYKEAKYEKLLEEIEALRELVTKQQSQ